MTRKSFFWPGNKEYVTLVVILDPEGACKPKLHQYVVAHVNKNLWILKNGNLINPHQQMQGTTSLARPKKKINSLVLQKILN